MNLSELRHDPLSGRAVFIAPERGLRTGALLPPAEFADEMPCPFCPGNEHLTPPALLTIPEPDWRCRVVPNRFPVVREPGGWHELIIESARHDPCLNAEEWANALAVVRQRLRLHRTGGRWTCGFWFKNHGKAAGSSLAHPHSQLLVLNHIPLVLATDANVVASALARDVECPYCRLIRESLANELLVVHWTDQLVALAAVAGRFPYETWILPRCHEVHFDESTATDELAGLLHDLLRRLDNVANHPAYNLILHTAPFEFPHYHWHIELLPRMTGIAGFELGTGVYINPLPPEEAAARLRRH